MMLGSGYIFYALLRRDLKVILQTMRDTIIDSAIIVIFTYLVYGHFLPLMGLSQALIAPIFLGINVLVLINIMYDRALRDAIDLDFTRFIDYQIGLPISLGWLMMKYIISYVLDILLAWITIAIFGFALFYRSLNITMSSLPFFLATILLIIFVLATGFLIEVFTVSFEWFRENTYPRVIMPGMLLGCIYYPWYQVAALFPMIKFLLLLSPVTYMVEGLRATMLDSGTFISIWICWLVLLSILCINVVILYRQMRKCIDAV